MNVEPFGGAELHLHVSGSISAALVPWWIHWLRESSPAVKLNVSVTPAATEFVSTKAIRHLVDGEVWTDSWQADRVPSGVHSGSSGSAEAIIVFPASLDTLMRLAQGRADSPALMLMQLTELPIVVADSVPGSNVIIDRYLDELRGRSNVAFAPRVTGARATTREPIATGFNLPGAIAVANHLIQERASDD